MDNPFVPPPLSARGMLFVDSVLCAAQSLDDAGGIYNATRTDAIAGNARPSVSARYA